MNISIGQPNNTMPAIGPTPVTADDIAQMVPEGYFATRQLSTISTAETTVEVTTAQGDQVTLTNQASLVDYYYIREEGMDVPGLLDGQESSENVSIEIQGELNQEEQDDIAALQKDLATLISSGLETDDNTSQSLLSDYDSLSQFTLSVQATKAKASAEEMTIVSYSTNNAQSVIETEESSSVATYLNLIV